MVTVRDFQKEETEALKRQNERLRVENSRLSNALGDLLGYATGAFWGTWRHYVADTCKRALQHK